MKSSLLFLVTAASVSLAVAQDGMVAVRDAQTGQLRAATAAELRALGATSLAMRAPAGQLTVRSDGRRQLHLGEAALVHLVLRRDADGHASMACVDGDEHGAADAARESGHAER